MATNARLQNVVLWSMWLSSRSVIPNIKHGLDSTWNKIKKEIHMDISQSTQRGQATNQSTFTLTFITKEPLK